MTLLGVAVGFALAAVALFIGSLVADLLVYLKLGSPHYRLGEARDFMRLAEYRREWTYPLVLVAFALAIVAAALVVVAAILYYSTTH